MPCPTLQMRARSVAAALAPSMSSSGDADLCAMQLHWMPRVGGRVRNGKVAAYKGATRVGAAH
eukprot:12903989-Prorocentrum_lima.AAC.1